MDKTKLPTPSISSMFDACKKYGRLAVTMVKPPQAGSPEPSIVVLLWGDKAINRIGPILHKVGATARQPIREPEFELDTAAPLSVLLKLMEANHMKFIWMPFCLEDQTNMLAAAFVGSELCENLAQILTLNGVPTSLAGQPGNSQN